ncbi:hypothetical protein M0R04_02645 [Candidatus Dojkabacteria bacterium]|jgi:hypothetical protein|nr:hypothetical protein [Candidatus Dojkabacteria bacterium]
MNETEVRQIEEIATTKESRPKEAFTQVLAGAAYILWTKTVEKTEENAWDRMITVSDDGKEVQMRIVEVYAHLKFIGKLRNGNNAGVSNGVSLFMTTKFTDEAMNYAGNMYAGIVCGRSTGVTLNRVNEMRELLKQICALDLGEQETLALSMVAFLASQLPERLWSFIPLNLREHLVKCEHLEKEDSEKARKNNSIIIEIYLRNLYPRLLKNTA